MLTVQEIINQMNLKEIVIKPYDPKQLNINSYDLRLSNKLLIYDEKVLDPKKDNKTKTIIIPEEGYILRPNQLYLGSTVEYTETYQHIPCLDGKSSGARLGICVHITAGFGDIGFCGNWTLEITVQQPVRVYPNMRICQISYHQPIGEITKTYRGKYQNNNEVQPSLFFQNNGE